MVSPVKWQQATSAGTSTTLEGNGALLANNTLVEANDAVYAGGTNLDTLGWLTFIGTFASAPTDANPTLEIYAAEAPAVDGIYDDAPVTGGTDVGHQHIISIPIQKLATAQRKTVGPIPLPGHGVKFYVDNQTGVSLNAAWTLTLRDNNFEGK